MNIYPPSILRLLNTRLVVLIVVFACALLPLYGAGLNDLTYSTTDGEVTITDCNTAATGELVIPETIGGNPVVSIGWNAFYDCTNLTSIVIPDSVTSMGFQAFAYCRSLMSVTIGNGVTSIGDTAFYGCTSLTSITIPDGVTSIEDEAFQSCSGLTSITISNSVTSIGDWTFDGCNNLKSITIPDSVTSIGVGAFRGCRSLKSITIPDSVTNIGGGAFRDCSSLTTIEVGANNLNYTVSDGVLLNKDKTLLHTHPIRKIDSDYTIPDSVTSIGIDAFASCSSLTSIAIPDSVTNIGDYAFKECFNLTSITIGNGVTSIGDGVFASCTSLTSITIPDNVTSIGSVGDPFLLPEPVEYGVFENCSSLTSITIGNSVTSIGPNFFTGCISLKSFTIPDGVTSIGEDAFDLCENLISITIPDSVTRIGGSAFSNCESLTSITIPDGITSLEPRVFNRCSSLTSITIPERVTRIGSGAFFACSSLTSITIPDSVTWIDAWTFWGCTSLTSITIPDGVTSIRQRVFKDCSNLMSITIGSGVTSIGNEAFIQCSSLSTITFLGSAPTVGVDVFSGVADGASAVILGEKKASFGGIGNIWNGLTLTCLDGVLCWLTWTTAGGEVTITDCDEAASGELVIPDTIEGNPVTSIERQAFGNCANLTSITIPDGVTSIENSAFVGCSDLTSITIPDSVTSIGLGAFEACKSLTSITIPNGITSIRQNSFFNLSSLTSITIPDSVISIEFEAFAGCTSLTNITFGTNSKLNSISPAAFYFCSSLPSITIPASVASIGFQAFGNCASLIEVVLVGSAPVVQAEAFPSNADGIIAFAKTEYIESYGGDSASWEGLTVREISSPPLLNLESFYESAPNQSLEIDALNFPTNYSTTTYQWFFNGFPIPEKFGGNSPKITIDGLTSSDGSWSVTATNFLGESTATFEYRVFVDTDSDGFSDYREQNLTGTNFELADTDSDGLNDYQELIVFETDPLVSDSDDDGFSDGQEQGEGTDPNQADSYPQRTLTVLGVSPFQVIEGDFEWQEAKADAESRGGRLAVLNTQAKIDAAGNHLQDYYGDDNFRVHIGLTDELVEGEYRWITGELLTASKWAGEEFLPTPGEDYISWYRTPFSQYGWFDHPNSNKEQYLFEFPAVENGSVSGGGSYALGVTATLTATPATGYLFASWNGASTATDNPLTITMNTNQSIGATFEQDTRDPDGDGLSNYQELVLFETDPADSDSDDDGYSDGQEQGEGTDPNQAESYPQRTLTVPTVENGSVSGGGPYALGAEAVLTATPSPGYVFASWNGDSTATGNPLTIMMEDNQSIGATFTEDTRDPDGDGLSNYQELVLFETDPADSDSDDDGYEDGQEQDEGTDPNQEASYPQRTLTVPTVENGSVSGGGSYALGITATLTATPAIGYVFISWDSASKNPLTITMDTNQSISAIFGPDTRDPDGDDLSNYQELVLFKTDPADSDSDDDGYSDGQEQTEGTDPNQAESYPQRTLTVGNVENGSVKGAGIFAFGTDATLEAIPDKGYVFQGWSGVSGVSGVAACIQSLLVAQASGVNILNAIDVVLTGGGVMSGDVNHPDGSEFLRQNYDAAAICAAVAQSSYGMVFTTVMTSDRSIEAVFTKDEADPDGDGLSNYQELVLFETDPTDSDSDDDGYPDGQEQGEGTDPNQADSYPQRTLTVPTVENGSVSGGGLYALGVTVTLTATPATGYVFISWNSAIENPLTITMDANKLIRATFEQDTRDPDGDGLSNYQELVLFETDPLDSDSDDDGFSDGQEQGEGTDPNEAESFPTRVLTINDSANGTFTGGGVYQLGVSATLQAIPDKGYLFGGWVGEVIGESNPLSITMLVDQSVGATFEADTRDSDEDGLSNYQELVVFNTDPTDSDSDDDGYLDGQEQTEGTDPNESNSYPTRSLVTEKVNNGSISGSGTYPLADEVVVTATPDPGFILSSWSGNASGSVNPLAVTMTSNLSIGAAFVPDDRDSDGDGLSNFAELKTHNTDPNNPDSDGDGFNDGLEISEETNPNASSVFPTRSLLVVAPLNGSVNSQAIYPLDVIATLTATPEPGYVFYSWGGDTISSQNPLSVEMSENRILSAIFNQDERDSDGDGLSNYDEIVIHATNPNQVDTDEDGFDDDEEILKGTDPNDSQAFPERKPIELRIEKLNVPSLVIFAYWTGEVGKTYRIEYAADFQNWNILDSGIQGTGLEQSRALPGPKGYVRVVEE